MQTPLQNGITINDVPGPTGGIMIKSATGATLIVNDTGIYIQNGKGASITMVGPTVTVNNGALTSCSGQEERAMPGPSCISAPRSCAPRRPGDAGRTLSAGAGRSGKPVTHAVGPVYRRRLRPCPAGRQRALRHRAQFVTGAVACHGRRRAGAAAGQRHRSAPLPARHPPVVAQTARDGDLTMLLDYPYHFDGRRRTAARAARNTSAT